MPSVFQRRRVAFLPGYYVYRIHRGIAKYAAEHGWILDSSMAISGQVPENWQGDGIISYLARRQDVDKKIESSGVPAVDLSYRPNRFGAPRVFHDNVLIGRMAGEHLLSKGFRDIGYVAYWEGYNDTERMAGLKEIVFGAGRHFHELHWEKIEEELSALPRPLALMIQNDYLAVTLLQKLEDLGVRVPEEVAVIGADNDELHCIPTAISITSVDDDLEQIGYTAAQTLDRMMNGEDVPELILVPPKEVIVRESTDTIAISHEPTSKALAYIRKNFCNSVSIDLLAERCGMSRRRLEDAFKKYVGRTMAAEIQRLRHDNVKRFLRETDLKLNAIAYECGYADGAHLSKSFKKQELITPQHYRLSQR